MSDIDFSDIDSLAAQLEETPREGELIESIKVELLQRGKYQPRRSISQEGLEDLAESIAEQGIIQPIIIRPINDTRYEIIAGERRWRAAQIAKLDRVPCIVRDIDDTQARAVALIENIDREDMELLDEILAIAALADDIGATEAAKVLGKRDKKKKKGFVSKCIKINKSPEYVHDFIQSEYSSDVDALYTLSILAKEKPEEAKALIQRWDSDPSIRTGLRKQVDLARKGMPDEDDPEPAAIGEAEKEEIIAELDADFEENDSVSHAKQSEGGRKKEDDEPKGKVSHAKQPESDEPPMVLESAVLYEDGRLVMYTNEGNLTFEVGEDAKEILRKAIDS